MNPLLQLVCDLQQEHREEPRARHGREREDKNSYLHCSLHPRGELQSLFSRCFQTADVVKMVENG